MKNRGNLFLLEVIILLVFSCAVYSLIMSVAWKGGRNEPEGNSQRNSFVSSDGDPLEVSYLGFTHTSELVRGSG